MKSERKSETQSTSKARLRAWLKILKVSTLVEKELRERFRSQYDSTLPRFDVMAALSRSDSGLKMSELSGVLRVSNGNVTGIIDRLVQDGLVIRVAVEGDRRANRVRLTRKGDTQFKQMAREHEAWVNELLIDLGDKESCEVIEQLAAVSDRVSGIRHD